MSFSLALTIVVGVEYGAKNYQGARDYTALGLELSLFIAIVYMALEMVAREYIALFYTRYYVAGRRRSRGADSGYFAWL